MNVFWRSILIFLLLATLPLRHSSAVASANSPELSIGEPRAGSLFFSAPETRDFPTIRFQFDAYSPQGGFISGLKVSDIRVIEDGRAVMPQQIEQVSSGLQVVVALNLSPALGSKAQGQSEYERIQNRLADWASSQEAPRTGDFSLSTPSGMSLLHSREPGEWVSAIRAYQPDLARLQPTLGSLAEALDLTGEPLNSAFIKRSILYITPPLTAQHLVAVPDLTSRARQTGARVNVWLLDPVNNGTLSQDTPLRDLAEQTGGTFQIIPAGAALPDPEEGFRPLRSTYQISYQSTIQKSGPHRLSLQVNQPGMTLEASERSFEMTVHPPNPIFLTPPTRIQRTWSTGGQVKTPELTPKEVQLQILIEFPDQHTREITTTRLFVDDQLVHENTAAPFDRFTWPVGALEQPGRHKLKVMAVDSLGLTGASEEIPVEVLVQKPAQASLFAHITEEGLIAISAVLVSGGVLALVLVLTSRQRQGRKRQPIDRQRMKDPLTQPVSIRQDDSQPLKRKTTPNGSKTGKNPAAKSAWSSSAWPVSGWLKTSQGSAPARLVALDENQQPLTGGGLPLARQEMTFGSDPMRATQLLESATVDGLHARLYRSTEGDFFLCDQNSVAGTWINYEPVGSNGARLEHGDLIHIGRVTFRFEWTDAKRVPAVAVQVTGWQKTT